MRFCFNHKQIQKETAGGGDNLQKPRKSERVARDILHTQLLPSQSINYLLTGARSIFNT
ncbi:unnamed protein product [Ixodes pacificus]